MIKHIWSVLCQRSVVDSISNNISLFEIFEELQIDVKATEVAKIPTGKQINIPFQYQIVNFWTKTKENEEERAKTMILIKAPNDKEINKFEKELIIPANNKRMRQINNIKGMLLNSSGIYKFLICIKQQGSNQFKQVAELPLEVKISKAV